MEKIVYDPDYMSAKNRTKKGLTALEEKLIPKEEYIAPVDEEDAWRFIEERLGFTVQEGNRGELDDLHPMSDWKIDGV